MKDMIDTTNACSCACANLQRTDLVVTQFYDGVLAPSGLYAIQFGLLATLSRLSPININFLAQIMDMDRTALARQLKILSDRNLVHYGDGQSERAGPVFLTLEGEQVLNEAWPLWAEAQERIETDFGRERFNALLGELSAMRAVLS